MSEEDWLGVRERRGRSEKMRVPRGMRVFAKTPSPFGPAERISNIW